jgi:UDP-glucose 4-epimerase
VARKSAERGSKTITIGAPDEWVKLRNLNDPPDLAIHCAGSASVAYSLAHPEEDYQKNVGTLTDLLEFIRTQAPRCRLVFPSSPAVYGEVKTLPIVETAPLNPVSVYGKNKKICEELILAHAKKTGAPVSIVRLFSVYGPGLRKQLLWDACTKLNRGENKFFGTGQESRDWLHVEDATELLLLAGMSERGSCEIINGASGVAVTVREVLTELFTAFGRSDAPVFTGEGKAGDPSRFCADIMRARAWGWQPRRELRAGLREYVEWFKKCCA